MADILTKIPGGQGHTKESSRPDHYFERVTKRLEVIGRLGQISQVDRILRITIPLIYLQSAENRDVLSIVLLRRGPAALPQEGCLALCHQRVWPERSGRSAGHSWLVLQ